ncbi:Fungal specific transcription factor [Pyrenophora tritici-repentis]|nr:Fungal specific transcription factor [Pyrenophora tritici-repentis]
MAVYAVLGKDKVKLPDADQLAQAVRDQMTVLTPPNLVTVQTLLVLSMYEWGIGNRQQAWLSSGMAIRMMQSLQSMTASTQHSPEGFDVHNRMSQPHSLSCDSLRTFWPSSEEDFVFGRSQVTLRYATAGQRFLDGMPGNMANFYNVLVRGFDIWARILQWVISGGRFLPDMSLPVNCPWNPTSPWSLLYQELRTWRRLLEERMLFPEASVESHAALEQAEPFAYLNLVYYISLIFLGREYLPFLPTMCDRPSGPADPPLLPPDAPVGWWDKRATELFASAASITTLMEDLDNADASLHTPFPGFCVFSAVTTNMYRSAFPWMSPDKVQDGRSFVERDLVWLDTFRRIWPVGERWWLTSQRCKRLYDHASADLEEYQGRARTDFDALEASIHDCRRRRPSVDEYRNLYSDTILTRNRTSIHLEEHGPCETNCTADTPEIALQSNMGWSQLWPLWDQEDSGCLVYSGLSPNTVGL